MNTQTQNTDPQNLSGSYRTPDGKAQIDWRVENGRFFASGNYNGSSGQCLESIAEDYPKDNAVHRLCCMWRNGHMKPASATMLYDLQTAREGLSNVSTSFYDHQAEKFLTDNGLKFRATLSDSKTPQWGAGSSHGYHYRVTISKRVSTGIHGQDCVCMNCTKPARLVFDFWSSLADMQKGIKTVTPYSVLACISGDIYTPETFADFCAEYGYESDSIKALQQFRRCSAFAKRLRAFFTEAEQAQLSEIQ